MIAATTKLSQSRPVYEAVAALEKVGERTFPPLSERSLRDTSAGATRAALEQAADEGLALDGAQRRIVEAAERSMRLGGVALDGEAKARFNAIKLELAELSTTFSNHVLDATKVCTTNTTNINTCL